MNYPFDYRPQKYDPSHPIDGETARQVARMYELYVGGLSAEEIADFINAEVTVSEGGSREAS